MIIKFALENYFHGKYAYLDSFILRTNIVIAKKDIKPSKTAFRKNELCPQKILGPDQGKKIKKFKVAVSGV